MIIYQLHGKEHSIFTTFAQTIVIRHKWHTKNHHMNRPFRWANRHMGLLLSVKMSSLCNSKCATRKLHSPMAFSNRMHTLSDSELTDRTACGAQHREHESHCACIFIGTSPYTRSHRTEHKCGNDIKEPHMEAHGREDPNKNAEFRKCIDSR